MVIGANWIPLQGYWGAIQLCLDYHLQEFSYKTAYLAPGIKYLWRF